MNKSVYMLMPIILLYYTYLRHPNALLSTSSIVNMSFVNQSNKRAKLAHDVQTATDVLAGIQHEINILTIAAYNDMYRHILYQLPKQEECEKTHAHKQATIWAETKQDNFIPSQLLEKKALAEKALAEAKASV